MLRLHVLGRDKDVREEKPPRPPEPVPPERQRWSPETVLALQRSAGNQATARVLARKIGFEFEADAWWSWRRKRDFTLEERLMPPDRRSLPLTDFEPLKKKDKIHQGNRFTLEADESKDTDQLGRQRSDIEFVTDPFDETPDGLRDLKHCLEDIRRLADGIAGMRQAPSGKGNLNWYSEMRAAGLQPQPQVHLSNGDRPLMVKMQSTFGLRLDQVMELLATFGAAQPGESKRLRRRRADARELMTHYVMGKPQPPGAAATTMGVAAAEANRAVDAFVARHRAHGPHYDPDVARTQNTDALKGLVAIITLYLKLGDQLGQSASYPKAIAALMARTDLAQLFRMLPTDQKIFLRKNDAALWLELIGDASGVPGHQPVLKGAPWLQELTVDLWLQQIPLGVDLLTQEGYHALALAMRPNIDQGTFAQMVGDSEMLESMGSMGAKTEGEGDVKAAIFELRAIPDYFPHTEIPRIANALGKYIAALNRGEHARLKL